MWANAYLRPARPIELSESIKSKFLPASDYTRAKSVDWAKMESVQNAFTERYLAEVR
jgi:putative spermidine/putrescine transport system substrate-binding protein